MAINQDFIKRYSSILRNKDLARLAEEQRAKEEIEEDLKKRQQKRKLFKSDYFNNLLNEPEFSFNPDELLPGHVKRKTISLDLQNIMPSHNMLSPLNKRSASHTKRSNARSNSNDYSSKCKKHTSNVDVLCTSRVYVPQTYEKIKNFYEECQGEANNFNKTKDKMEKKINNTQKKAGIAYNKLKKKEKSKTSGISNNFKEFINQREFKRKLINNLISQSSEAEKNFVMISYKQKQT